MAEGKIKWEDILKVARQRVLDIYNQKKEEEQYLNNLSSQYVVSKRRNYSLARSIVLDIHITEEYYMSSIIGFLCSLGGQNISLKIDTLELIEAIGNIDCFKKISIIEKLNILSARSIEIIKRLNILRNAFAHGYKEDHPNYNYKGKSIFQKEGVDLLAADHKKLTEEVANFLKGNHNP